MFVKIKEDWPTLRSITSTVHSVFHGTHFDKMTSICTEDYAFLKPHKKKWRVLDRKDYNKEYCSYTISPGQSPEPFTSKGDHVFGPVVWFSTRQHETDNYGPCQFEFNFNSVLEAYQRNRGRTHKICYRTAGTLVYDKEVSHVVLICCMEDKEHEELPLITGGNTTYFTPPVELDRVNGSPKLNRVDFQVTTNEYCIRHEHVAFAIYQPRYQKLCISINDGLLRLTPHQYCIPSKKIKCKFACKQTLTVDKLYTYAAWLTSEAKSVTLNINCYKVNKSHSSVEQPIVKSFADETNKQEASLTAKLEKLDKSLEESFYWLGDMDATECCDQLQTLSEDYHQHNNSSEHPNLSDDDEGDKVISQLDKRTENGFDWLSDVSDTECDMT